MNEQKNILVTGGAGFIGAHISKRLIELGYHVIIVDNFNDYYETSLKEARIEKLLINGSFTLYRADIKEYDTLLPIFKQHKIDHIIHLAAQAGVRYSIENPFIYANTNIIGTLNIFELARMFRVDGITAASSSSVYGNAAHYPVSENTNTDHAVSFYAATKKSLEVIAHSYHHLYQIPITCLRYFTVYGPWGRPDMAPFKFTQKILNHQEIEVYGEGNMERDFTYIDDIVDGTIKAMQKNLPFEILNLGQGNPVPLMYFIECIEKYSGLLAQKKFLPMQPGDVARTYADNTRAKSLLGWEPHVKIDEGVEKFIAWYREYYSL